MREIKFRGKRLDNGEWLYGNLVELRNPFNPNDAPACFIMPKEVNIAAPDSIAEQEVVDPDTVGQFTGLLDKNGKEIYEGDVIKVITFGFDPEKFITEIKYGCSGGVLGFHLANGRSLFYFGQSDYSRLDDTTIIGNIHDNPELLSNDEHDPGTSVN